MAHGDAVLGAAPFFTFYPAVLIATFLSGFGPGVGALVLGAAVACFLFLPVQPGWNFQPETASLAAFLVISGTMVALIAWLNKALDHVLAHEQNIRTLLDAAPSGVVVVNEAGEITFVNPMAERLFGYTHEELIGRSVDLLVPEPLRNKHSLLRSGYMKSARARAMGIGLDLQGRRKDGERFPVEVGLAPVSGGARVMATVIEISERKKARERQQLMVGELRHRARNLLSVVQAVVHRTLIQPSREKELLLGAPLRRVTSPLIRTCPVGVESAPYFAALVASSWRMRAAKHCAAAGDSTRSQPLIFHWAENGSNSRSIMAARLAPSHFASAIIAFTRAMDCRLAHPDAVDSPFYRLFPDWLLYPMTLLATAATVIASQAVISGAFSLSQQAMQLSLRA